MIDFQQSGQVARLTINSPATGNRFTYQIMLDFIAALEQAAQSDATVLVLSAQGDDFTLGRDQKEQLPHVSRRDNLGLILRANAALRSFPGVSIVLINGRALGFGTGLALHSTISIAAADATLGFDEIVHNLAPLVVVAYLPYFIAPRVAEELVLTGRPVAAEEAQRIGLVTRVVPPASLRQAGEELVELLSGHSAGALKLIRQFAGEGNGSKRYPDAERSQQAVEQLVQWLEAGRP
ncbi:enoyl-CoA hydratase/isomerase family protein [Alcaligenaceae bacterium]|nr:enoyl-CoA hydratase/isomerase family protein [Alcaligenaceae bacterium]